MVAPTRLVFEGDTRTQQITLINSGSDIGRYRISMIRRQMFENGSVKDIKDDIPGKYSDKMIRFSPRQVTLPPGKSQTIRVQLRKPRNLEDAEYRSHMLFQTLPETSKSDIQTLTSEKTDGIKIELIPIVGISIPIIVRHGQLESTASISNFNLSLGNSQTAKPKLSMDINRKGTSSTYGDFVVEFTPKGEQPVVVGQINGVAVYTPLNRREFSIDLQAPEGTSLSNGELHVKYLQHGKSDAEAIIAEARMALP